MGSRVAENTRSRVELVPVILIDEVAGSTEDYTKETVQYINKHYDKVKGLVRKQAKGMSSYEIEEVLSDVIVYFAKANDYSLSRACKSDGSDILDIEAYISKIIKYSICRRRHNKYMQSKHEVSILNSKEGQDGDGREFIDSIGDEYYVCELEDTLVGDIHTALQDVLYLRNKFNDVDIYELIYIKMIVGNNENCECLMQILGHNKKDLIEAERRMICMDEVKELFTVLTRTDREVAIREIGKYIYCKNSIDAAIGSIM